MGFWGFLAIAMLAALLVHAHVIERALEKLLQEVGDDRRDDEERELDAR